MSDSRGDDKRKANPPCPKCDSDRVNKIGHERDIAGKGLLASDEHVPPSSFRLLDYTYLCERCGHSWKAPD